MTASKGSPDDTPQRDLIEDLESGEDTGVHQMPAQLPQSKIVVTSTVVYQSHRGENIASLEMGYGQMIQSQESPYSREIKVTEEWKELSYGWIVEDGGSPGIVCIKNVGNPRAMVQPSQDDLAAMRSRVVEVSFSKPEVVASKQLTMHDEDDWPVNPVHLLMPPQFGYYLMIAEGSKIWLRCRKGTSTVAVVVHPG